MWQNEAVVGKQHLCTSRTSSCSLLEYTVWELETDPSLCLFYYQRLPACSVLWTLTLRQVSWRKKKAVRANHEALQSELNNCPFENPTWAPHELIRAVKDFVLGVSDGESWLPRWKKKKIRPGILHGALPGFACHSEVDTLLTFAVWVYVQTCVLCKYCQELLHNTDNAKPELRAQSMRMRYFAHWSFWNLLLLPHLLYSLDLSCINTHEVHVFWNFHTWHGNDKVFIYLSVVCVKCDLSPLYVHTCPMHMCFTFAL